MSIDKQREHITYLAKLAWKAKRYNDIVGNMKSVARLNVDLTLEERALLGLGYRDMIGAKRASWRTVSSFEQKEVTLWPNGKLVKLTKEYRLNIERELSSELEEWLSIIDNNLLPNTSVAEARVFYLKKKGDSHWYLAELKTGEEKMQQAEDAKASYQEASLLAKDSLVPTHPIRLEVALFYAVFYYEILHSRLEAIKLAKQAIDDAVAELDHLNGETKKDSTVVIQRLKYNVNLWTSVPLGVGGEDGNKSSRKPQ